VITMPPIAPPDASSNARPDPDETLAVPHFEDQLLDRLLDRQRSGAWSRSRARRLPRWAVAAAAAVVVLAGGLAGARGAGDRDHGRTDVDTAATDPTDDQVRDSILAALDGAIDGGSIVHITAADDVNESWIDLRTGAERNLAPSNVRTRTLDWGRSVPPGIDDEGSSTASEVPTRLVDDCLRQYADRQQLPLQFSDAVTPIRDQLAAGGYVVDGTVTVDGRQLIRVAAGAQPEDTVVDFGEVTDPGERSKVLSNESVEMLHLLTQPVVYVDPATYLPVTIVQQDGHVSADLDDGRIDVVRTGPADEQQVEFLPRTAESLALLVPPVPAGYTLVDQLALDEVRAAGCVG
jgi:hypothetical protein